MRELVDRPVLAGNAERLQLDHVAVLVAEEPEEAGDVLGQSFIRRAAQALAEVTRGLWVMDWVPVCRPASSPTEALLTDLPFVINLAVWLVSVVAILYWAADAVGAV